MPPPHPSAPHRKRLTIGAAAASLVASGLPAMPVRANGLPSLAASRNLAVEAATTFNGSHGIAFTANGDLTGTAGFSSAANPLTVNNSGTAFLSAMVAFDGGSAGILAGVSGLSNMVLTSGSDQYIIRGSSEIFIDGYNQGNLTTPNISPTLVVSGLTVGGGGSSSTVGASLVGTNKGTEVLQVNGRMGEQIINKLSAF